MKLTLDHVFLALIGLATAAFTWRLSSANAASKSARNEQRKLTATALNNLAVGIALSALIIPAFQSMNPSENITRQHLLYILAYAPLFIIAVWLHVWARHILSNIEE